MKKLPVLALALLMLTGCAADVPEPTTPATTPVTEEVVITHNTLEVHDLPYENILSAAPLGDDILLHTTTSLVKLDGKRLKEIAVLELEGEPVQISPEGLCCRSGETLIFLNSDLDETHRMALPDAAIAVTADLRTVYYSNGTSIRAIDRDTGLDRLLRETTRTGLTLEALALEDSILVCREGESTLFYSAATGELVRSYTGTVSLSTHGTSWLAILDNSQVVFGTGEEAAQSFIPPMGHTLMGLVPGMGAILVTSHDDDVRLALYGLETGAKISGFGMQGDFLLRSIWGDTDSSCLWFLRDDAQLCRLSLEDTTAGTDDAAVGPYYNRENPDAEGLAALESGISEMENYYGVEIHIYEDAVAVQPADMVLNCEYQVDALTAALEELDLALARFTPEFLANGGRASNDDKVHICLVRSVDGEGCFQFWDEEGNARIALAVDGDLTQNFYHGLAHIIDARVMSECGAFDNWKRLNPSGFSYSYDYTAQGSSEFSDAFADARGMISPVEDRACIFARAMLPGMDGSFESQTMQDKLSTLCAGIRKAFRLDAEEAYSWEQYLTE